MEQSTKGTLEFPFIEVIVKYKTQSLFDALENLTGKFPLMVKGRNGFLRISKGNKPTSINLSTCLKCKSLEFIMHKSETELVVLNDEVFKTLALSSEIWS